MFRDDRAMLLELEQFERQADPHRPTRIPEPAPIEGPDVREALAGLALIATPSLRDDLAVFGLVSGGDGRPASGPARLRKTWPLA